MCIYFNLFIYVGQLYFLNVQHVDYLLSGDDGGAGGKYLCVVFNPFLRTSADGDDQCLKPIDRPGIVNLRVLTLCLIYVASQESQLIIPCDRWLSGLVYEKAHSCLF